MRFTEETYYVACRRNRWIMIDSETRKLNIFEIYIAGKSKPVYHSNVVLLLI